MDFLLSTMRGFSIRARMTGAVVMVLAMFALVGGVGVLGGWKIKSLNEIFMTQTVGKLGVITNVRDHVSQVRLLEKQMMIDYEDTKLVAKYREAWTQEIAICSQALTALLDGPEDEDNVPAREAVELLKSYVVKSSTVLNNIQSGNYDSARVGDKMMGRAKEDMAQVEQRVQAIAKIVGDEASRAREDVATAMSQVMAAFMATVGLVILTVVPLTLVNSVSITKPIAYAAEVAQAIAVGDLSQPISNQGSDEASALLASLAKMQTNLRDVVGQVRESSHSIQRSSAEVASGNGNLSQRTEQASGSLQQTASSMEQLTATVRHSTDAASQAKVLAASAAAVAQRGGSVMTQVVSTMEEINSSSRRISDIIGAIDGIAFQTNILALNAAVEAARAGDQGRGFAVVASEVRNLAQRSAGAAREIKSLIGASVERVQAGTHLVADAGSTMNDIVASVQRVSDIIGEISSASSEQSQDIGQVNQAVSELDAMTQQNAAMVEQSAAAAESLAEQATRLNGLVDTFRLQPA